MISPDGIINLADRKTASGSLFCSNSLIFRVRTQKLPF
jgi:hypothetical protein